MQPRHSLPLIGVSLLILTGCSSSGGPARVPDASSEAPTADVAGATDTAPDGRTPPTVDDAPPIDNRAAIADGNVDRGDDTAPVVDTRATAVEAGETGSAAVDSPGTDAAQDSRSAPGDASSTEAGPGANDAGAVAEAGTALVCTPEQLAARQPPGNLKSVSWADIPAEASSFLTSFLPIAYIEDHFRFFVPNDDTSQRQFYMTFEYGCETVKGGQIQLGLAICDGVARYVGPSRDWELKIDRVEAARRIAAAGCDASNLDLQLAQVNTPIPGIRECLGLSFYLAWAAGGQHTSCSGGEPAGCICSEQACSLQADTGDLTTRPPMAACPGTSN